MALCKVLYITAHAAEALMLKILTLKPVKDWALAKRDPPCQKTCVHSCNTVELYHCTVTPWSCTVAQSFLLYISWLYRSTTTTWNWLFDTVSQLYHHTVTLWSMSHCFLTVLVTVSTALLCCTSAHNFFCNTPVPVSPCYSVTLLCLSLYHEHCSVAAAVHPVPSCLELDRRKCRPL